MEAELIRKIFKNKANNQMSITLPKRIVSPKSKKVRLIIKEWMN
jgi:hypothetical protein